MCVLQSTQLLSASLITKRKCEACECGLQANLLSRISISTTPPPPFSHLLSDVNRLSEVIDLSELFVLS